MGYIKERMTVVLSQRPIRPYGFTAESAEILPFVIAMDLTGTDTTIAYTLKTKVRVIDAWAIPTASVGSATVQITDHDDNAITDAMDISTDSTVVRPTLIDDANWDEIKGQSLKAVKNTYLDKCWLFIKVVPMNA